MLEIEIDRDKNMRFIPAEPDIATVFGRINDQEIDLQPDFQRGEVWPPSKKQRLIDSILRGWVVPPVLLISNGHGKPQQVLDGQQRLASIRDFMLNEFPIDGRVEPVDDFIQSLHGVRFNSLPSDVKRAFLRTPVRMYEITDYKPEEPAEIFFRLNQPTGLTSAEKRNAFFGPVRDEIRRIVDRFEQEIKTCGPILGFSNSRMAFDDVFARFACTLEMNTLRTKVTAAAVNQMYRRTEPLRLDVLDRLQMSVHIALDVFQMVVREYLPGYPRLNKATFFSWLIFFSRLDLTSDLYSVSKFFIHFEAVRAGLTGQINENNSSWIAEAQTEMSAPLVNLIPIYSDRASARVADVSSVLLRDFALWASWHEYSSGTRPGRMDTGYEYLERFLKEAATVSVERYETSMLQFIDQVGWGEVL